MILAMRSALGVLCVFLATTSAESLNQTPDGFNPEATREALLKILDHPQKTVLKIHPLPLESSKEKALLNHFQVKIWPRIEELSRLKEEYKTLYLLRDSALYRSEIEKEFWDVRMKAVFARAAELSTDKSWTDDLLEWGRLADGLSGDLAGAARRAAKKAELEQFPEEAKPWLQEVQDLQMKVDDFANTTPNKKAYLDSQPVLADLEAQFHAGKLSFADAAKQRMRTIKSGTMAYGKDVALNNRAHFKKIAELNTKLAKLKGFRSWAEYSLAKQAQSHAQRFQGIDSIRTFLLELLDETDNTMRALMERRAWEVAQKPLRKIHPFAIAYLYPQADVRLRDYFPKERFVEIWRQTMLESGFPEEVLKLINVDAFPRDGKQSHAYLMPIRNPEMKVMTIDGRSLNIAIPDDSQWYPAAMNILQNFTDDGIEDLRTMFHEGGHALEHIHRRDNVGFDSANGYVETHSMTMEYFNYDREFLLANGKTRDGRQLDEQTVEKYLSESLMGDLAGLRGQVFNALFDIELWDVDYTKPETDFVGRAIEVAKNLRERLNGFPLPEALAKEYGFLNFTTGHFYSGEVSYFGYVFAEVSSSLVAERAYDLLERATGRRSFYRQPELAKILSEGIYRRGFAVPYPESIESFTSQPFSPKEYARRLVGKFKEWNCEAALSK